MKKLHTLYTIGELGCVALLALLLLSCSRQVEVTRHLASCPVIFPDYKEVTVPRGIARSTSGWRRRGERWCLSSFPRMMEKRWRWMPMAMTSASVARIGNNSCRMLIVSRLRWSSIGRERAVHISLFGYLCQGMP